MKTVCIADIHGRFDLLIALMDKLQDTHGLGLGKDKFVFLGDYCDRGKQNKEVVEYLSTLKQQYGGSIILLKGNHEQLAEEYVKEVLPINRYDIIKTWMNNGGYDTVASFGGIQGLIDDFLPFINTLELYYETDDLLCVHGGIPVGKTLETATEDDLLWTRGSSCYSGKLMIVGHTIVKRISQHWDTLYIDTGAFYYGKLSAVIFPDVTFVSAIGVRGISVIPRLESVLIKDEIIQKTMRNDAGFCTWLLKQLREEEDNLTKYY